MAGVEKMVFKALVFMVFKKNKKSRKVEFLVFMVFLRASAMLKHVIDSLDVRPSVRPSVTRWHPIKTAEYIVMLSSPHDSPFILVFCVERSSRNSDGVTPCGAAKGGV